MKFTKSIYLVIIFSLLLCGCEGMGFNPRGVDEALTPGIDADTTVRTWSKSADGAEVPTEKAVANPQAFE